jgi:hypothetical protein
MSLLLSYELSKTKNVCKNWQRFEPNLHRGSPNTKWPIVQSVASLNSMFLTLLYPYVPVRSSATECMLIYYISTAGNSSPPKDICNPVPWIAYECIE